MLVNNPWEGGGGYSYEQVARMTLDQIWARLCEDNILKRDVGKRTEKMQGLNAASQISDKDGNMRGRAADGTELKLKTRGQSKAKMLKEGTYEGWAINASTGEKEWITPKSKKTTVKDKSKRGR